MSKREDIFEIDLTIDGAASRVTVATLWLPLDDLVIDDLYQRTLNEARARRYAVNWSDALAGLITVSHRKKTDTYAILDGQHRARAARIKRMDKIWCEVFFDLTPKQEAFIFRERNRKRTATSSIDDFRAGFVHGDPQVVRIARTLSQLGVEIKPYSSDPNSYSAVSALTQLDEWGVLKQSIELTRLAWPGHVKAKERTVLLAMGTILWNHRDKLDKEHWVKALEGSPLVAWLSDAASMAAGLGHSSFEHLARLMLRQYNKGRREKLDENLRTPRSGRPASTGGIHKG